MTDKPLSRSRQTAERINVWLDAGGREKVRAAVRHAIEQTRERNKRRQLPEGFLDRRFTI